MAPSRHQTDLQKACIAFIASTRRPAWQHAIYGQTVLNQETGDLEQRIVIHRHPDAQAWFELPKTFQGYPVIEQDWPTQDL